MAAKWTIDGISDIDQKAGRNEPPSYSTPACYLVAGASFFSGLATFVECLWL
jgi:hypothetical protein